MTSEKERICFRSKERGPQYDFLVNLLFFCGIFSKACVFFSIIEEKITCNMYIMFWIKQKADAQVFLLLIDLENEFRNEHNKY